MNRVLTPAAASLPGPATEQNVSGTGVSSPGPSARQEPPIGLTRDSWNDAWETHRNRDSWADVGTNIMMATSGPMLGVSTRLVTSGVRVTGRRVAGTRKTSVVTIATSRSG